jgi:hypothetical protein
MSLSQLAWTCTPEPQLSTAPRLVNGEWVNANQPSAKELTKTDFDQLNKKGYTFVFSGIYTKEISFNNKPLSHIKTKNIWQGKVTDIVDIDQSKLPTDNSCSKLKFDHEYIFFAKLGSRNNPIQLKEFRAATPELKSLLGKPAKQWLRGRLIHSKK